MQQGVSLTHLHIRVERDVYVLGRKKGHGQRLKELQDGISEFGEGGRGRGCLAPRQRIENGVYPVLGTRGRGRGGGGRGRRRRRRRRRLEGVGGDKTGDGLEESVVAGKEAALVDEVLEEADVRGGDGVRRRERAERR